jgi:hypothetical protein
MNERIKELAEQAGIEEWWDSGNECREVLQEHLEKLAESIVKECSNFLKDTLDDHFAAEQLEEHFGVEE